jgi:hypothetical protein
VVDQALDDHVLASARAEALASVEALLGDIAAASGVARDGARLAAPGGDKSLDREIADVARQAVRRVFGRVLGFKPVTTVAVLRVER